MRCCPALSTLSKGDLISLSLLHLAASLTLSLLLNLSTYLSHSLYLSLHAICISFNSFLFLSLILYFLYFVFENVFPHRFEIKTKDALTALESRLLVERTAALHSLRLEMQIMIDKAHVEKDEFQALYSKVR